MNLLNKFSIKARLLILVLCPLALGVLLVTIEVKKSIHSANQLNTLTFRIKSLSELVELYEGFHSVRLQKLNDESAQKSFSRFSASLVRINQLVPFSGDSAHDVVESLKGLEEIGRAHV